MKCSSPLKKFNSGGILNGREKLHAKQHISTEEGDYLERGRDQREGVVKKG
jgi:hypothetical protein